MECTKKVQQALDFISNLDLSALEMQTLITALTDISDDMGGWYDRD